MQWDRSLAIGIANAACTICEGVGVTLDRHYEETPCDCVLRAVFRACYQGFIECVALGERTASVSWERCGGPRGGRTFSRKREEYIVDFLNVAERHLEPEEHRLFRYYFILGADSALCGQRLQMDRGTFFHCLYRVEKKLGRVYAELKPYPLYPLRDYFGGVAHKKVAPERVYHFGRRRRMPLPA
ncbi:MAG TPA: hypothetical protein VML19_23730 [Verrucomicrobiae bacterium]|nr:hypothetical protein [Verrucomicrobiae bacterium]